MKHIDAGTAQLNDDTDDDGRKPDDVRLEDPGSIYEIPCFLDKYERQLPISGSSLGIDRVQRCVKNPCR